MLAKKLLMVFPNPFRAVKALFRSIRAYYQGDRFIASGRVAAQRRKICNQCPRRDAESDQCLECTCFLGLKTELTAESCPLKKW